MRSHGKLCAPYFPRSEQHLMEDYDELKHIILKEGNTAAVIVNNSRTTECECTLSKCYY